MHKIEFDSKMLPDGHLYIPKEFMKYKNSKIKVIITVQDDYNIANDKDIEASSVSDISEDFLSEKELDYYLNLKNND